MNSLRDISSRDAHSIGSFIQAHTMPFFFIILMCMCHGNMVKSTRLLGELRQTFPTCLFFFELFFGEKTNQIYYKNDLVLYSVKNFVIETCKTNMNSLYFCPLYDVTINLINCIIGQYDTEYRSCVAPVVLNNCPVHVLVSSITYAHLHTFLQWCLDHMPINGVYYGSCSNNLYLNG